MNFTSLILYRRVRASEQRQLLELCENDENSIKYYSSHKEWILNAINEVKASKDRVVFGAFQQSFVEGVRSVNKLIGCIFLKRSKFENTIELKNLILPKEYPWPIKEKISRLLIEKAIRFCETRNVEKVEIELPQDEHKIISVFLSFYFKVIVVRDRYTPIKSVCILEKNLGNFYFGDPFSNVEISKWLLKQFIPCDILTTKTHGKSIRLPFECITNSSVFSRKNIVGYHKRLTGEMWIIEYDPNGTIDEEIALIIEHSKRNGLKILYTEYLTQIQKNLLQKNNFTYFDYREAKQIAGPHSSMNIPFDVTEIGGVLTVLEYEDIIKYSQKKSLTYYLFGISNGLTLDNEEPRLLLVYCPYWLTGEPGIVGYFEIQKLSTPNFSTLIKNNLPDDSALTKDDLKLYKLYSDDEQVGVLKCLKFILLEEQQPIYKGNWISNKKIEQYLINEIYNKGNNSIYIDNNSCQNLLEIKHRSRKNHSIKYKDMILTTIATVVELIANSTTIFDFTKDQLSKIRERLIENDNTIEQNIATSPLKVMVDAHVSQLDKLAKDYASIVISEKYMQTEKDRTCRTLASQGLDTLKILNPFKKYIKDYESLLEFFQRIATS